MKKLASVLAVGLALSSAAAMASDGTLTVNGLLTDNTCTVNGGTQPVTVTLPTLSTSNLKSAGQTAGDTAFKIELTNCSAGVTSAKTFFENSTNVSNDRLDNKFVPTLAIPTKADNVQVQLLNSAGAPLLLSSGSGAQGDTSATVTAGAATLNYFARYYANGISTPGGVMGLTTFTVLYN